MRLDIYLKDRENISRTKALRYIENGQVTVNGICVRKAGYALSPTDRVELKLGSVQFVSQGGYKLYKGLQTFQTTVQGKIFADIGASTGGFTDCLLQFGAKKVYAVDVGKNQLDSTLSQNEAIVILDERNARNLTVADFQDTLDGIVIDVSFISLKQILPTISALLQTEKEVYALIKPQFETAGKGLDKHGIVKQKELRHLVLKEIVAFAEAEKLYLQNITEAPILPQKNIEYIAYFQKDKASKCNLQKILKELH